MNRVTLTVVRASTASRRGDPVGGSEHVITNCILAPRVGSEVTDSRDIATFVYDVYCGSWEDVVVTDHVRFPNVTEVPPQHRGQLWSVDGPPLPWSSPWSAWSSGMQFTLRRATG